MASTYFIDNSTPIVSAWLNDVNNYVYQGRTRGTVTATASQTVFTVPFTYSVGGNDQQLLIEQCSRAAAIVANYINIISVQHFDENLMRLTL